MIGPRTGGPGEQVGSEGLRHVQSDLVSLVQLLLLRPLFPVFKVEEEKKGWKRKKKYPSEFSRKGRSGPLPCINFILGPAF